MREEGGKERREGVREKVRKIERVKEEGGRKKR